MAGPTGFGPPPGTAEPEVRPRRASYLPPGGLLLPLDRRYGVTRSAKPGIVPLKPLGFADVLDGAVKAVRRNPATMLGLSALTNATVAVPAIVLATLSAAGSWLRSTGVSSVVDARSLAWLLGVAGTVGATLLLTGVLAYAVAEATLGHRPRAATAWASARPRLGTLLVSQLVVLLAAAGPWALLAGVLAALERSPIPLVLLATLVLTVGALAVDLLVVPRLLLSGPAAALEGLGVGAALRRSWRLVRGRWWTLTPVVAVAAAVAVLLFWMIQLPQWGIYVLVVGLFEPGPGVADAASTFAFTLASLVSTILVTPFVAATVVLRYVDARMRAEGFDLVLLRAAAAETRGPS